MRIRRGFLTKCTSLLLLICFVVNFSYVDVKAATIDDLNQDAIFIKQQTNYTCTLAAAVMMVRRAALATGNTNWKSITESSMRADAWREGHGLWWSFTHVGISVNHGSLSGTEHLKTLLANHPEGIEIYNNTKPHAILITDYTNGQFYCADPAVSAKRIPVSQASITVGSCTEYWYVSSPKVTLTASNYTIAFAGNGGTNIPASITRTYGQNVTFPSQTPKKVGYEFGGWLYAKSSIDTSVTSTETSGSYMPGQTAYTSASGNICWTANDCTYVATWKTCTHSWNSGSITTQPTCTAAGVKTYTCTKCSATKTESVAAKGHSVVTDNAVAATCTTDGKTSGSHCSVCSTVITAQTKIAATGHSWNAGTIIKNPSSTVNGEIEYTCTVCNTKKVNSFSGVTIDDATFQDSAFQNYIYENFDNDKNRVLSESELASVKKIEVTSKGIESLAGIEHFSNLETLICNDNKLSSLNVSKNTRLKWLDCINNQIKELDLTHNTSLTNFYCKGNEMETLDIGDKPELIVLECQENNIGTLDVSKCSKLKWFYCWDNNLSSLDVKNISTLYSLQCGNNQLKTLDVTNNLDIVWLYCNNNELTELNVSKNTKLEWLDCINNQIKELDLTHNTSLTNFYSKGNEMETLSMGDKPELIILECQENNIGILDVSRCPKLKWLYCWDNNISSLAVDNIPTLFSLQCKNNPLRDLDVSSNPELTWLMCENTGLTSLDVSENPLLYQLFVDDNQLRELNVTRNLELNSLHCKNNLLNSLDVSNNAKLTSLMCQDNKISSLNVNNNSELLYLLCSGNQINELDVSNNANLRTLECQNNCIKSLDVSKNTKLVWFYCNNNQLTSLDVSSNLLLEGLRTYDNPLNELNVNNNTELIWLYCWKNNLNELDVSNNTKLKGLQCNNNSLFSLDVSNNTLLETLYCDNNQLKDIDISNNLVLNDLKCNNNPMIAISSQPSDAKAVDGSGNVTFAVKATGRELTYQWYWRKNSASEWSAYGTSGSAKTSLSIGAIAARNGFQYYCKITNKYGVTEDSKVATLTVVPAKPAISIISQPSSVSVKDGSGNVKFSVLASGVGLKYQWYWRKNASAEWGISGSTGAKTATLTIDAITARNGFQYYCKITDANGGTVDSNAATLTVVGPLKITKQPVNVTAENGSGNVNFSVTATGTGLTYQWFWRRNADSEWAAYTSAGAGNSTMSVGAITARNGFQYYCKIKDSAGTTVSSNVATLTVKEAFAITKQPVNVTAANGSGNVNFSVTATGTGLTYQWFWRRNANSAWAAYTSAGAANSTMSVGAITARNGFQYYCLVKDSTGKTIASNVATLKIVESPFIIKQPADVTAKNGGSTVKFKVEATGAGLTYQWYWRKNVFADWGISGSTGARTATLSIDPITARNGFQYFCVVKDSSGNITTTDVVTLTVTQ